MDKPVDPQQELPRSIGVWGGAAIMIGVIIGSGIFATPPMIAKAIPNPPVVLMLWVFGGLICLCGALVWTELSTMFPQSGGLYVFIREAYGPPFAFVFGWTFCFITQPMAVAAMALVSARHVLDLFQQQGGGTLWFAQEDKALACAIMFILTYINVIGMKRGAGVAIVLTAMKALALAAIVIVAIVMMKGDTANFQPQEAASGSIWLALVTVMAGILWTFDGWSDAAAVAEEVKEPNKKLPQVFILGTLGVTLLYLAANAVFFWMLPMEELQNTDTVAPLVMEKLLGPSGKIAVTVLVVVATLGSTQASIIIGSRVAFAQSRDRLLFRFLSSIHRSYKTPDLALWGQCLFACSVLWILDEFKNLAEGFVFTAMIFYLSGAVSLYVFRVKRPNAERSFRCWGYPVVPAIFILFATGLIILQGIDDPNHTIPYIGFMLLGFPIYFLWKRYAKANPGT